ncbi:MAG TPA: SpoIID/LytB domain-containing protein [Firmicutes bacterium]|nr:SpoIID/LytB domain-containing protein [Candidatus Fermentithermobacillaceae bacterium]
MKKVSRAGRSAGAVLLVLLLVLFVRLLEGPRVLHAGVAPPHGADSPQVLVGLFRAKSVTFRSGGKWFLATSAGEKISLNPGNSLTLAASGQRISWEVQGTGAKGTSAGNILVSPASPEGPFISVSSSGGSSATFSAYRGSMVVLNDGGNLLVANAVAMEEYVQSVVGAEMIDSWPLEAARAQAVAVRSYAAYKTGLRKDTLQRDYVGSFSYLRPEDVLIWATDQVYRGIAEETERTIAAASSTRGEILTYQGLPAATYYHADAGGMTEDPCYVWGRSVPYLVPVVEVPHESPHSSWEVVLMPSDLSGALERLGTSHAGTPDTVRGLEQGVSGRWFTILVGSGDASCVVRGTDLRSVLPQIKSTLFSAYVLGGGREVTGSLSAGMCFSVAGAQGARTDVHLGSSYVIGGFGGPAPLSESGGTAVLSGLRSDGAPRILLQGAGWGHGVGLSQWGAREMALMGKDAWDILELYYPGLMPEKWW